LSLPTSAQGAPVEKPGAATVVLAGDLMLARRLKPPTPVQVRKVRSLLGQADLIIGNLETPQGPCLAPGTPEFPRLCASKEMIRVLPALGFTGLSLANNHMLDAGKVGLRRTRRQVRRLGMAATRPQARGDRGAPTCSRLACPATDAVQALRLRVRGHRIVLLAFNATVPGQAPPGFPPPVTPDQVRRCTARLTRKGMVIASIHHGREYAARPTPADAALVRAAVRGGARIVVGHHPHVVRKVGWIKGAYVAWSLGNFASDQRNIRTRQGMLLRVVIGGAPLNPELRIKPVRFNIVDGWPVARADGGS